MNRKYAAVAALAIALTGCASSGTATPAGTARPSAADATAACKQALADAYRQHQAGADTGDMPKPAACAGIPDDAYLQLALQVMHGDSPTGP